MGEGADLGERWLLAVILFLQLSRCLAFIFFIKSCCQRMGCNILTIIPCVTYNFASTGCLAQVALAVVNPN